MTWRYFGRTGGMGKIVAIYRIPSDLYDKALDFKHFRAMELLQVDGTWVAGQSDRAEADWMHGWFDDGDEITEAEAQRLIATWKTKGWPGHR